MEWARQAIDCYSINSILFLTLHRWLMALDSTGAEKSRQGARAGDEVSPTPAHDALVHQVTPRIISCGQRSVLVPKSSLVFPAWLVQLPSGKLCWRSKRDIWRLGRNAPKPIGLPKQAFDNLLKAAPWMRPDYHGVSPDDKIAVENRDSVDNWMVHCTKSLWRMDQFLAQVHFHCCQVEVSPSSHDGDASTFFRLRTAWIEFCRPLDTENLVHDLAPICSSDITPQKSSALRGNELGQYFCSVDSADRMIRLFSERIGSYLVDDEDNPRHVTVVEPSCGDGRLLQTLWGHFQRRGRVTNEFNFLVGVDIDATVIDQARRSRQHLPASWKAMDFLKMRRSDLLVSHQSSTVLILGGPPYSAGAGSVAHCNAIGNEDDVSTIMERDLPLRFVQHAIQEIQAEVICFLMPERYRHSLPLQQLLEETGYDCSTQDCDSLFHFRGQAEPIKQPSIIQIYWRIPA